MRCTRIHTSIPPTRSLLTQLWCRLNDPAWSAEGVRLERITIAGETVAKHADWSLNVSGNVTDVTYV